MYVYVRRSVFSLVVCYRLVVIVVVAIDISEIFKKRKKHCLLASLTSIHPSIHPFFMNTYTNLVRGLGLEDTTSDDVTFVDTNGDS